MMDSTDESRFVNAVGGTFGVDAKFQDDLSSVAMTFQYEEADPTVCFPKLPKAGVKGNFGLSFEIIVR
jgi:hypothetical protein